MIYQHSLSLSTIITVVVGTPTTILGSSGSVVVMFSMNVSSGSIASSSSSMEVLVKHILLEPAGIVTVEGTLPGV